MSEDLYQNDLLRLAAEARGTGRLQAPDASVTLDNPLCGDRITLDVQLAAGRLSALGHEVRACVLCQAAASVIGRHAVGETPARLRAVAGEVRALLKPDGGPATPSAWPEIAAFQPVAAIRSRHVCVELPFKALVAALDAAAPEGGDA